MTAGPISDAVLPQLAMGARVVICGTASVASWDRPPTGPRVERHLLVKRARMAGVLIFDYQHRYEEDLCITTMIEPSDLRSSRDSSVLECHCFNDSRALSDWASCGLRGSSMISRLPPRPVKVPPTPKWKHDGVRVIPGHTLDPNTAQTPGMDRKAAINLARVGAQKIWAGTVSIQPNAKTGAHHHGELESVIYVVRGKARMRWGDHLEFVAEAGPGDFIYVPPFVPHQEINASQNESLECVLVRSDNEAVVVNLDIEPIEKPEQVAWIDPIHKG